MRVQLEHDDKTVDLEDDYKGWTTQSDFLDLVERALASIGYDVEIKEKGDG